MKQRLIKVNFEYDQDAEDPSRWDSWRVVSFNRRHSAYDDPDNYIKTVYDANDRIDHFSGANIGITRKLQVGTAFLLSYSEHGLCQWKLSGEQWADTWDSCSTAGMLIWEGKPSELGKTLEERQDIARSFLETYADWCNGNVHGWSVEAYEIRPLDDPDSDDSDDFETGFQDHDLDDSCWGYYGSPDDYTIECAAKPIADYLKSNGFTLSDVVFKLGGDLKDSIGVSIEAIKDAVKKSLQA